MDANRTTAAALSYFDDLAAVRNENEIESIIRTLIDRAVRRLHQLCASLFNRGYPGLTQPPLNLQSEEVLSAGVEQQRKATKPANPLSSAEE